MLFQMSFFHSTTIVLVLLQRPVSSGKKITPNQVCFLMLTVFFLWSSITIPFNFHFLVVQNWQACCSVNSNRPDMA